MTLSPDALDGASPDSAARTGPRTAEGDACASDLPLVSVLLPVRDGARYLEGALASIRSQTLRDWELVAVDDGSTDATSAILARAADDDPRIRVIRQEPLGLVCALQRAVGEARAPYLARMDADDESMPQRLERQLAVFESDEDVVLVGGSFHVIEETGRLVRTEPGLVHPDDLCRELFVRNPFAHGSVMLRRSAMVAAGGYRFEHPAAEDYDLWRRLAMIGNLRNLPEVVYRWRLNPRGVTRLQAERQRLSGSAVRDSLWTRARPPALDRSGLRRRMDAYRAVPVLGSLLADRFRQVHFAIVAELLRRRERRDAARRLLAFAVHRPSGAWSVLVFLMSGYRFTSGRGLLGALCRRMHGQRRRQARRIPAAAP